MTDVRVPIAGMTCAACERRVAEALTELPDVRSAQVSSTRGIAVLTVTAPPSRDDLDAALRGTGYTLGHTPWITRDRRTWLVAAAAGAIVAGLVGIALVTGFTELGARMTQPGAGGLLVVALVGLAAGVSTCMALVGGVVLAVAATYQVPDAASALQRMRPHLAFQVGRIVGFGLLGAALGWIGSALVMPPVLQGVLMLVVAAVMALLGLRLTGVSPRLAAWSPSLPASWGTRADRMAREADAPAAAAYSDVRAALAGAATFFLPCGFTQAVQLYALSTGSPVSAGLTMAVFAVGTSPGLLALASLPNLARGGGGTRASTLMAVVGVVLIGFAAINAYGGLNVLGLGAGARGGPQTSTSSHPLSDNVQLGEGVQTVTMVAGGDGYSPATTYVAAGVPIRWQITSTAPMYCTAFLRAPDLGVSVQLKAGSNTVDVPALALGTWPFTCVMGMYNGTLVAVNPS